MRGMDDAAARTRVRQRVHGFEAAEDGAAREVARGGDGAVSH